MSTTTTSGTRVVYQSTELSRRHREVLDAARSGSAVIRDTDGLSLTLMPTEVVQRDNYVCEGLRAALVMLLLLRAPLPASPSHYGRLG